MAGIFILSTIIIIAALSGLIRDTQVALGIIGLTMFGILGGCDDYYKITLKKGITARTKFIAQWICALLLMLFLVRFNLMSTVIELPFFNYAYDIGSWYIVWGAFIVVACSNAINLTDGLDGLAASCLIPQYLFFAIVASSYNATMAGANMLVAGSVAGFLWYNRFPARVFMGDVGSLALGAWYAYSALVLKIEFLIPIVGIVFLVEELSVMMQVVWYKRFKTRLFKMAPIHHHFELSGWHEQSITTLCAAITAIGCVFAYIILMI